MPVKNELGDSAKKLKLLAACLLMVASPVCFAAFEIGAITAERGTTVDSAVEEVASLSELLLGRIGASSNSGDGSFLSVVAVTVTSHGVISPSE